MESIFNNILIFMLGILSLSFLVFIHELGHFLVAKWNKVKVRTFSIGFGKKLLKFQSGAQIIANKLGLKVQPVLIIGSKEIIDSKKLSFNKGVVKVVFLPSFVASEGSEWLAKIRENMQKILDEKLAQNS